jgi:hypothetical protein
MTQFPVVVTGAYGAENRSPEGLVWRGRGTKPTFGLSGREQPHIPYLPLIYGVKCRIIQAG